MNDFEDEDELAVGHRKESLVVACVERETALELMKEVGQLAKDFVVKVVDNASLDKNGFGEAELVVVECRVLEAMQDMQAIRKIRAERPLMPLICISSNTEEEFALEVYSSGATAFFSDSVMPEILVRNIEILRKTSSSARMIEIQNRELVKSMTVQRKMNDQLREEMHNRIAAEVDRKEAQEALMQATKMASLGEMASGIAHEIRSPLSIITGTASVLREELDQLPSVSEDVKGMLDTIEKFAERVETIVRGLKGLAREDEADPFEKAHISQIVEETLAFCEEQIRNSNIDLRIKQIPADLTIECRPTQISQIIVNLVGNARHAIEACEERWIDIEAIDRGDLVALQITDSGPGIPAELREKVLEAFFTTKKKGVGTGLGLSISRKICKSHGGDLSIDDSCQNTRFIATFRKIQPKDESKAA